MIKQIIYYCFPCTHLKEGHELENNNIIFIESKYCATVVRENNKKQKQAN